MSEGQTTESGTGDQTGAGADKEKEGKQSEL